MQQLARKPVCKLVQQTLQSAFAHDPLGALVNGIPGGEVGNDAVSIAFENAEQTAAVVNGGMVTPEPGTLILLGTAATGTRLFRRRRA